MVTFPVCEGEFCYITLPASETGRDDEAQIYTGTTAASAVLSAVISLYSPLEVAISGTVRSTLVTSVVPAQRQLLQAGGSFHVKQARMERLNNTERERES